VSTPGMIRPEQMNYGLDDRPKPFAKALGLGVQHVLTMFGATVAVPLLLGPAMGIEGGQLAILVSSVMIASGVATLIQVRFGTRLPIIQGVSFAFLGPFFAIIAATVGGEVTMQYIAGAIIAGAVLEIIIGYGRLFGLVRRFISPVVIGPVIALIGLALFQVGAPQAGLNWWLAGTVIAGAFLFSLVLAPRVRFFSLFPILLAVVVAYLVALAGTLTGVIAEGAPGYVSFDPVREAPWFRSLVPGEGGVLFPWGLPQFHLGFILATLAGYLASMIESFGDYYAVSRAAGAGDPTERQINNGIGAEGVGCALTGVWGGFASTSYTENIGLVALTRTASRFVVYIAAVVLILLGLFTKVGAVIATIPEPIVGGLYCTLFGLIASIGISNSARADLTSQRNLLIIGFLLFMGLSVPAYFAGVPGLGFEPVELSIPGAQWLADAIQTIGSTGMAVAAILGIALDNLIPGSDRERGLVEGPPPEPPPTELPGAEG
jgi:solute carrier family 23 (nucleobase transporter), member 1